MCQGLTGELLLKAMLLVCLFRPEVVFYISNFKYDPEQDKDSMALMSFTTYSGSLSTVSGEGHSQGQRGMVSSTSQG